jgi:ketosteroid isomerase-like protein
MIIQFVLLVWAPQLRATNSCDRQELKHQRKDAVTVQRLDATWTAVFLRGDTQFLGCLLIPQFTEIMRSGQLKFLADELDMTAKNRGKNLEISEQPKTTVLRHGNVAVAYGKSILSGTDGKPRPRRYADFYVWENGRWHVFFAQQTPVEID